VIGNSSFDTKMAAMIARLEKGRTPTGCQTFEPSPRRDLYLRSGFVKMIQRFAACPEHHNTQRED